MFIKPERKVTKVFIHCSANDNPIYAGHRLHQFIYDIHVAQNKWDNIGYHFMIDKVGQVIKGRDIEVTPSAQKGHNRGSIAIMVHGLEEFTLESMVTLRTLCEEINNAYDGDIEFWEHNEVDSNKTCPVFPAKTVLNVDANHKMIK
jgi:N-acetylmuramoyl-L-alanine amidase